MMLRLLFTSLLAIFSHQMSVQAQGVTRSDVSTWNSEDVRQMGSQLMGFATPPISGDSSSLLVLLEKIRIGLNSPGNISAFRSNDNHSIISKLVIFSAVDDAGLRFNSASILANVTDNTTLCVVLDKIVDRSIDVASRYNLLQTAKVVSTFATRDNSYWIRSTINDVRTAITGRPDVEQTLKVLVQIEQNLDSQKDQFRDSSMAMRWPEQFKQCTQLPSIAGYQSRLKDYNLFIHTKRTPEEQAKLKPILGSLGLIYRGEDSDEDPSGGFAVDYSTKGPSSGKMNRDIAQLVADTINANFQGSKRLQIRPQSAAPEKAFGVWF